MYIEHTINRSIMVLHSAKWGAVGLLMGAFLLLWAGNAHAANVNWDADTPVSMTGITGLTIKSGSKADSFVVEATTFTVALGASTASSDVFIIEYTGGQLQNTVGLDPCRRVAGNPAVRHDLAGTPSRTIVFTPNTSSCGGGGAASSGSSGGASVALSVNVVAPNGGETWVSGNPALIAWSPTGSGASFARLSLSTDGGVTYATSIVQSIPHTGQYSWIVPSVVTTTTARVKVEALSSTGSVLATDVSNSNFTIQGTTAAAVPAKPATPAVPTVKPAELAKPVAEPVKSAPPVVAAKPLAAAPVVGGGGQALVDAAKDAQQDAREAASKAGALLVRARKAKTAEEKTAAAQEAREASGQATVASVEAQEAFKQAKAEEAAVKKEITKEKNSKKKKTLRAKLSLVLKVVKDTKKAADTAGKFAKAAGLAANAAARIAKLAPSPVATESTVAASGCLKAPFTTKQLQQFLKDQGHFSGNATGVFGSLTRKAVQAYQEAMGIAQPGDLGYGNVGPATRAKLAEC